jgi:hypothetical protein
MNFIIFSAGQCNDAFFRLAKSGRVSFSVDRVKNFTEGGLHLVSGNTLHADVVVLAAGCKYISRPHILHGVNTGGLQLQEDLGIRLM